MSARASQSHHTSQSSRLLLIAALMLATMTLAACGEDDAVPKATFSVADQSQSVDPDDVRVYIYWVRHEYGYYVTGGEVPVDGSVTLPLTPPPAEFRNGGNIGVGYFIAIPASESIATGGYTPDSGRDPLADWSGVVLGGPDFQGFIFRGDGENPFSVEWPDDFPGGVSCAQGVRGIEGQTFDSFEPVPCSELSVLLSPDWTFPEWS